MPDFRWSIQVLNELKAEVEMKDVSDRTALKIGIAVVVAVAVVALGIAAMILLR